MYAIRSYYDVWSQSAAFTTEIDLTSPTAPVVTGTTPTVDTTPEWSWTANADVRFYRYGFSESSWISVNATAASYTPASPLDVGDHTLYVQGQDAAGNWSLSGSFMIRITSYNVCYTKLLRGRGLVKAQDVIKIFYVEKAFVFCAPFYYYKAYYLIGYSYGQNNIGRSLPVDINHPAAYFVHPRVICKLVR